MRMLKHWIPCIMIASTLAIGGLAGCTKKPSQDELTKLEEAKTAAEKDLAGKLASDVHGVVKIINNITVM